MLLKARQIWALKKFLFLLLNLNLQPISSNSGYPGLLEFLKFKPVQIAKGEAVYPDATT
jgi:hypothetical protein